MSLSVVNRVTAPAETTALTFQVIQHAVAVTVPKKHLVIVVTVFCSVLIILCTSFSHRCSGAHALGTETR